MTDADELLPVYDVRLSEPGEIDIDAVLQYLALTSPETADRWHEGVLAAFRSLSRLPNRCPLAPENARFARDVRQLLYRHGRAVYRILFTVFEADGDELGFVSILRLRHGAQKPYHAEEE